VLKKKIWANFQRIIELFTKKIVTKLSKIPMDLGSGIRKKPIPDPGSRGQKGTGSRIRIHNTADITPMLPIRDTNLSWNHIFRFPIPNPGVKKELDPGSGSATLN
jgi:hypothetical protein